MKRSPLWLARVEGRSMQPTLAPGDVIVARRRRGPLRPGQVVVVELGGRRIVKRVAAVRGSRCRLGVEQPYGWVPTSAVIGRVIGAWSPRRGLIRLGAPRGCRRGMTG